MAVSAFAAYIFFALLVKGIGHKAWPESLPSFSYNSMSDSVYEHIQNRTLGVSSFLPCRRLDG
jgi:hypothetical protein